MADDAWQSAWVEVVPDFTDFRRTANKQMTGILGDAGDDAGKTSSKRAGSSFIGGIPAWGKGIIGAFAGLKLGQMLSGFLFDSVALGSDLTESSNAIKVAYGAAFADIAKLGKGSAKRLGLSELDFNSIATQFSAFAKSINADDPSAFIDALSKRGADFASVFNLDVADALSLFQSGLAGENEPLRRYGIDLSAAAVAAFAYSHGIANVGDDLTETQKQQARYMSLLEQTDGVQGDFKNTSDELANSQRIFQASLDDTKAKLGTALLPAMKDVVAYGNETFIPMLDDLVTKLTTKVGPDLGAFISEQDPEKNQVRIDAFMADLGRRLGIGWDQISVYFGNEFDNSNVVMGAKLQLGWSQIADYFTRQLGEDTEAWRAKLQNGLDQIGTAFQTSSDSWAGKLANGGRQIGDFFNGLYTIANDSAKNVYRWFGDVGKNIVEGMSNGITSGAARAIGSAVKVATDALNAVKKALGIASPSKEFFWIGQMIGAGLTGGLDDSASSVQSSMLALTPDAVALSSSVSVPSLRASLDGVGGAPAGSSLNGTKLVLMVSGRPIEAVIREEAGVVVGGYEKTNQQTQQREYGGLY